MTEGNKGECRNQTVPELVEGPSLGYAEPMPNFMRAKPE